MRKYLFIFIFIISFLLSSCSSPSESELLQYEIESLESQISKLEEQNNELAYFIDEIYNYADSILWDIYYPDDLVSDYGGYVDGIQDFVNDRYAKNYEDFTALVKALREMNDRVN